MRTCQMQTGHVWSQKASTYLIRCALAVAFSFTGGRSDG